MKVLTGGVTIALLGLLATAPAAWQYSGPDGTDPISGAGAMNADDRLDVPMNPVGRYDPTIMKPELSIGYPIGARFTPHYKLVRYFETIAEQSDRAEWRTYGMTNEGRPLGTLVVSSPGNMAALATIQADLRRLADPSETSGPEARKLAERLPIVVWLSYNIHGDEASSSEAALAMAYELVAGTGTDVTGLLDSLIVVIDPCLNPDGRDRYVNWVTTATGREPNPGPDAWEHNQPWPGGRYNHYVFDLNRDWAWLTQVESRTRHAEYRRWLPQVHVDFHEMYYSSSYFFFPAAEPFNTNLLPQVRYWGEVFGQANAAAFDERGWTYFTAEDFDLYYPGYGDSWPSLQGATGMTYEQAGGRGLRVNRPDGTILTLRERARHHFVASMATLQTARRERERRLVDFHSFFEDGLRGDLSGPAVYLFPPGTDPGRTSDLVNLLISHGAEVERATEPLKTGEVRGYDGRVSKRTFPEGTFIVPMRQPMRALLNSLLEPEADIPETLFYDVTAWSLPLAFGVDAYWSDAEPRGKRESVTQAPPPDGGLVGPPDGVAWLLPWDTNAAPRVLNRLLRLGVRASFTTRSFETEGRLFDRGTIVIPAGANQDTVGLVIDRVAREFHQPVFTARSGWTGAGVDLGSNRILPIRAPRIAIVNGEGVNPTSFGALWFLLDDQYDVPLTVIPLENLGSTNLSAYNVLIFPDDYSGHGHSYDEVLDSLAVDRVRRWARSGGVFIGLKGGAAWATADLSGLTRVELKPEEDEEEKEDGGPDDEAVKEEELARKLATVDEEERLDRLKRIPGTILSVKLDPGHPLAYGYAGEAHIIKTSDLIFQPSENGRNVAYYTESPRMSGYISRENVERLARTPFVIVEPLGAGRAVLYNDDPNFRFFWHGLNRLFLNSLFFSSGY